MNNPIHRVTDESGAIHTLSKRIGKGGQGEVWLTEGGRRIVKLLGSHRDSESLRRQFAFIRRLDLSDLHVARPIAVLKPPHVGYVAEFLGGMIPIKALLDVPSSSPMQWYIGTGGLRRRLRLLAHAGEALVGLHARGCVYGDVSHNNVFVSQPINAFEAWLIDLDNLTHDSNPRNAVYTPSYGAPEVVNGLAGSTSLSDAWAFAVLIWQTLTLTHPFVGDLVSDGEPEMEEKAFAGGLPWVGHSSDARNVCSSGLPHESVLAKRLMELAQRTFQDGLTDRKRRPGVSEWVERLHAAADRTVLCGECHGSYFVTEPICPWCNEPRPNVVPIRLGRWQPGKGLVVDGASRLGQLPLTSEGLTLSRRITQGLSGLSSREPQVKLELVDRGISVRTEPGVDVWVASIRRIQEEQHTVSERGVTVPLNGWVVFFDKPDQPQRVALLGDPT